jgi:hypothetical protein
MCTYIKLVFSVALYSPSISQSSNAIPVSLLAIFYWSPYGLFQFSLQVALCVHNSIHVQCRTAIRQTQTTSSPKSRFLIHASTNQRGIAVDGETVALAPLNTWFTSFDAATRYLPIECTKFQRSRLEMNLLKELDCVADAYTDASHTLVGVLRAMDAGRCAHVGWSTAAEAGG